MEYWSVHLETKANSGEALLALQGTRRGGTHGDTLTLNLGEPAGRDLKVHYQPEGRQRGNKTPTKETPSHVVLGRAAAAGVRRAARHHLVL